MYSNTASTTAFLILVSWRIRNDSGLKKAFLTKIKLPDKPCSSKADLYGNHI